MSIMNAVATPVKSRKPRQVKPAHGVARLTLTVKGTDYAARFLDADPESGVEKVLRLRKADGEVYHLAQHRDGSHECTCPDFEFSRRDTGHGPCKHLAAAVAARLLDGPPPQSDPDTWEEWTDASCLDVL